MDRDLRSFVGGIALGVLLATAIRAFASTLWYLSLVTLRLNGSAWWFLALLAPLLLPVARGRWPLLVAGLATAGLAWTRLEAGHHQLSALASGAALLALAGASPAARVGAVAGLVLDGALLVAGGSQDPLLSPVGAVAAVGLTGIALLDARAESRLGASARASPAPRAAAGVAWGALLAVEIAYLASPFALSRHAQAWPALALGVILGGVAIGLALSSLRPRALLATLALGCAMFWMPGITMALVAALGVQAALVAFAARLAPPHPATFAVTIAGALFGLTYFTQPLGGHIEWGLIVPGLALLAGTAGLRRMTTHARIPRAAAATMLVGLLALPTVLAPAPAAAEVDDIVVVNWNVHQGFGNRGALDPHIYAKVLAELAPDIVILQESDTARLSSGGLDIAHFLARHLGLAVVEPGLGVAVLSRFPKAEDVATPPTEGWTARVALDVGGTIVHVQGVHYPRSAPERAQRTMQAIDEARATGGPRIFAGDVNSCPAGSCFGGRPPEDVHARLGTAYQDAWSANHSFDDPAGNTHPAASPRRRIDVIMVRGFEVLDAAPVTTPDARLGSDHLPMMARLRFA